MMLRRFALTLLATLSCLAATCALAQPAMRMQASVAAAGGKILVAGENASSVPKSIVVGRLNADGTVDGTFGGGGWTSFSPPTNPASLQVTGMAVLDDGGILVSALNDGSVALLRLTTDGYLDTAFGAFGGFHVDTSLSGVRVNAMANGSGGNILGFGSANNAATGGVTRAAVVRFDANGGRDEGFGIQLPVAGESEFRAAERIWNASLAVAGYAKPGGWKQMLVALIGNEGQLDTSQSWNGHSGIWTTGASGFDFEAFGVAVDNSTFDIVAVGRDGHSAGGLPASYMTAAWAAGGYYNYGRLERYAFTVETDPQYLVGDSTGMSIQKVPGTLNDWLVGGTVVNPVSGRAYFGHVHHLGGYSYPYTSYQKLGPITNDDHVHVSAYPSTTQFVAVGTREATTGGEYALRLRYFRDNGDFDTDFSQASPDTTPNAFAFLSTSHEGASPGQTFYEIVRITGVDTPAPITVSNAQYSLGSDNYCDYSTLTSAPGTVANGQYLCFVMTTPATPATTVTGVLDVGGVQATLAVTSGRVPETTLVSTPGATSGPTATFSWSVDPGSASSECSLDAAPFGACTNPLTNLSEGSHTFRVRGVNEWGADPTPATYTWNVLQPANTTITSGPPAWSNATSVVFTFTASRPGTTFECRWYAGGTLFTPCTSGQSFAVSTQGGQWFEVRATDASGPDPTPAQWNWTADWTPPTLQLYGSGTGGSNYSTSTTATFNFSYGDSSGGGATAQCQLDGGAFVACTSPFTQANLAEGNHVFGVRAVDAAGNLSAVSYHSWTIDLTPPDTTIVTGPTGATASTSATFGFSSEPGASFECRLDAGAWAACANPATVSNLSQGAHTFEVRAKDAAGGVDPTPASRTWTVDTAAPDVTITSAPALVTSSASATFEFRSSDAGATFECALDSGAANFSACTSPAGYGGLAEGSHGFSVRARDTAGNTSVVATHSWTVDTTAGDTTITSGPSQPSAFANATFTLAASEQGATFECRLDAGPWSACSSGVGYSALADGSHTFEARSRDSAGNLDPTPAAFTWVVDTSPPVATVTSGPSEWTSATTVTFTFTSNKPGSTFLCFGPLQPAGQATPCSSPISYGGFTQQGNYIFSVWAVDAAGRVQTNPTSYVWNFDNVPPDTLITSGPGQYWGPSATFTFSANEPSSTFECRVDAAAFAACTSPVTYNDMADGAHTFQVRSTDRVGQVDATPSSLTWIVDTVAPETSITQVSPVGPTNQNYVYVWFTAPEPDMSFECSLDGAAFGACGSPVHYTGLADGSHTVRVRARDQVGNVDASPASVTWTIDTVPAETTITAAPASPSTPSVTISFTSNKPGSSFECRLDAQDFAACTSPMAYSGLAGGSHSFYVRARDPSGNLDITPASVTWTVDAVAPDTAITSAPSGLVASSSASISFSTNEPGSVFECSLDGGAFSTCTSPVALANLGDGTHAFQVRARDPAGNVDATPATASWTVDTTAPDTAITASPASNSNSTSATFAFVATESPATFECRLDAGAYAVCTSPKSYTGLAQGSHTFSVRAKDAAANLDASAASFSWTIDTAAPNTTLTSGPSGNNNASSVTFTFTSSEANATFECKMDTGAFAACASPMAYNGLAAGAHTFQVRSKDAAGNVDPSPASRNFGVK